LQRLWVDAGAAVAHCQLEKATTHPEDPRGRRSRVTEPEAESESARPAACRRVEDDVVGPGAGESDAGDEAVTPVAGAVGILVVRQRRVAGEPVLVAGPDHARLDFDAPIARSDRHAEVCDPAANLHAIHDFATREANRKRRLSRQDVGIAVGRDAGGAA
jgi:hypothetical protein